MRGGKESVEGVKNANDNDDACLPRRSENRKADDVQIAVLQSTVNDSVSTSPNFSKNTSKSVTSDATSAVPHISLIL